MSSEDDDAPLERKSVGTRSEPKAADNGEDAVGYKRPPKMYRYRNGQSGNPGGRPRKDRSRGRTVRRVLLEKRKVDLTGTGRPLEWMTLEIVVIQLRQVALEGNTRAFKMYTAFEARYGEQDTKSKGGVVVIPYVDSLETWIKLFGPKD